MDKIDILLENFGDHLKNNWGKYAAGAAGLSGAAGLADSEYGEGLSDIATGDGSVGDKLNQAVEYTGTSIKNLIPTAEVTPDVEPTPVPEGPSYSEKEKDLLNYMRNELPKQSVQDMNDEINKHIEKPWYSFGGDPQASSNYNQGNINSKLGSLLDNPSDISRAEASNYVDDLYDNVSNKDNQYMDYGDEKQGTWGSVKDFFGKSQDTGNFNDTYMKNLDDEKQAAIDKIIQMRDAMNKAG